jgi:hypothetical protein
MPQTTGSLATALWIAHEKRCVYTHRELRREDVTIDHIIPKSLRKQPQRLAAVLRLYGLPSDFDVLGLENVVPVCAAINAQKRDSTGNGDLVPRYGRGVLPHIPLEERQKSWTVSADSMIRYGLECAWDRLAAVRQLKEELDARATFERLAPRLLDKGLAPADLHDIGATEEPEFVRSRPAPEHGSNIRLAEHTAYLSCNLPAFPELRGTALLMLRHLKLRDCMVTFDQREIAGSLLRGHGLSVEERPIVHASRGGEDWVHLGGTSFWIPRVVTEDICALIDDVAQRWIESARRVERDLYRSTHFPWARRGYRLFRIPRTIWPTLLRFARAHRHGAGTSEWHVFGRAAGLVITGGFHEVRAVLHAEWAERGEVDELACRGDVWICWDPRMLPGGEDSRATRFRSGDHWNAEAISAWLARLIPHALAWAWMEDRRSYVRDLPPVRRFTVHAADWIGRLYAPDRMDSAVRGWLGTIDLGYSSSLPSAGNEVFASCESLRAALGQVQSSLATHRSLPVAAGAAAGVYRFLNWCLIHFELTEWTQSAALQSVYLGAGAGLEDIVSRGQAGSEPASACAVDYALRGVLEVLRDGRVRSSWLDVRMEAETQLAHLFAEHDHARYLRRLAEKPW